MTQTFGSIGSALWHALHNGPSAHNGNTILLMHRFSNASDAFRFFIRSDFLPQLTHMRFPDLGRSCLNTVSEMRPGSFDLIWS